MFAFFISAECWPPCGHTLVLVRVASFHFVFVDNVTDIQFMFEMVLCSANGHQNVSTISASFEPELQWWVICVSISFFGAFFSLLILIFFSLILIFSCLLISILFVLCFQLIQMCMLWKNFFHRIFVPEFSCVLRQFIAEFGRFIFKNGTQMPYEHVHRSETINSLPITVGRNAISLVNSAAHLMNLWNNAHKSLLPWKMFIFLLFIWHQQALAEQTIFKRQKNSTIDLYSKLVKHEDRFILNKFFTS